MSRLDHRAVLSQIHRLAGGASLEDCADGDLLERFRRGHEEAAFAALVRRHGPMVLGVCRRVLGDRHDAEDAFQAAFLVLARKAASIRRSESLGIWLHRVARQLALRARANRDRRHQVERGGLPDNGAGLRATKGTELADELSLREALAILDEEIGRLPDKFRAPVVLCYLQGKTNEEAARELGCAAGTLKTRLGRARELLGQRLTSRGVALSVGAAAALMLARGASEAACLSAARAAIAFAVHETTGASGAALQLAHQLLRTMTMNRIKLWAIGLAALALVGSSAGALVRQTVWGGAPPATTRIAAASSADPGEQPQAKADLHGDPLPPGAVARLGTVRWRHGWQATLLAFAASGKEVVTAGPDGLVRVWDAATGKEVRRLGKPGESGAADVNFMRPSALSADGKWAATWDSGGVRVWDVGGGKELRRFEIDAKAGLLAVALTPDGKGLLTSSMGGKLILWDVATGKEVRRFDCKVKENAPLGVGDVVFSPDGKYLAAPFFETVKPGESPESGVRLWDAATGKEVRTLSNPAKPTDIPTAANRPVFSADGKMVARVAADGTIRLHDTADGKEKRSLGEAGADEIVIGLALAPDGKALAVLRDDGKIHLYDTANGKELHTFADDTPRSPEATNPAKPFRPLTPADTTTIGATPLAFAPDGKALAVVSGENAVCLWDTATGKPRPAPAGHRGAVTDCAASPDGKTIVTHSTDGTLRRWERATGKALSRTAAPGDGLVAALSPTGRLLAYTDETTIHLWDVAAGKDAVKMQLPADGTGQGAPYFLVFSPDEKVLATSEPSAKVRLWDADTGKALRNLAMSSAKGPLFPGGLTSVMKFSRDGRTLLTVWTTDAQADANQAPLKAGPNAPAPELKSTLFLWDVATGVLLRRWEAKEVMADATFTPDGRAVVTASAERVTMWEAATGQERFRSKGGAVLVSCRPDGRALAAADGAVVRLLAPRTGQEFSRLKGHDAEVQALAYTPDGKALVSGSADSTALVWDAARLTAPAPAVHEQSAERLNELWSDLEGKDTGKAFRAIVALEESPKGAVTLLAERVKPVPAPDAKQLKKWIADLDSDIFETREKASTELGRLGDLARPALEGALKSKSAETRRRVEELLGRLKPDAALSAEDLRGVRAIEVLAKVNTPEARRVLQALARGAEGAWLTREAKSTLERLDAHAP